MNPLFKTKHSFSSSGSTDYVASYCPERAAKRAAEDHGGRWTAVDTHTEEGITYQIVMRE